MDPSLLQPSRQQTDSATMPSGQDEKPPLHLNESQSSDNHNHHHHRESPDNTDQHTDYDSQDDENPSTSTGPDGAKRPRLRLAHACDRCRKRKIRCDTHHPCGPCQATKNECTFHTPSRRPPKPKDGSSSVSASAQRSSSTAGFKRPHSPVKDQTALEARLAALEAMLRDVPPNVHNAFLSRLDARLGSGTGVGIKEGKGEGVGVALEALGGNQWSALGSGSSINGHGNGNNAFAGIGQDTLVPDWNGLSGMSAGWAGGRAIRKPREEAGVDAMAKRMEGMSFFYEDEIGQAKWQGATSGFPLLEILTAANVSGNAEHLLSNHNTQPANNNHAPSNMTLPNFGSPMMGDSALSTSPSASTNMRRPSMNMDRKSSSSFSINDGGAAGTGGRAGRSPSASGGRRQQQQERFFPDRTPRPHQTLNPEASWKVITGVIPPDLMDTLVRCYLSTSHLLWPFLHVPSFLADYANPQQWGEPGFACFIVAVCTLSSRHVDDPRVRANPVDPSTAGKQYFELFKRLRDLPSADRPTLYSIQAAFLAAVYAFGLGNLSKAFALQAESITLCLDGGLHRSVDGYDHFDAVEKETRKRTFWAIYSWDKQSAALFGRPPIIHLRDCDVTEPIVVDDENLTKEGIKDQPNPTKSRICAFVAAIRLHVILEGVIDSSTQPSSFATSPFLAKAASTIARRSSDVGSLADEEDLLEEWSRLLPRYWHYDTETANSRDPVRITQAERLHCLEHLVKMIIYRHRFSGFVAMPASTADERARHLDLCRRAMQCALTIIADHVHISQRGMMTYYGVHVIHQLAQAGRTLVAVILNCRNADFRPLIASSIEGLRSCVGLLRRFSGRYLCGLRSADIIDEFCRICNIPVDSPRVPDGTGRPSPAWLRPVRKRASPSPSASRVSSSSPAATTHTFVGQDIMSAQPELLAGPAAAQAQAAIPADLEALFNANDYMDLSGLDSTNATPSTSLPTTNTGYTPRPDEPAYGTIGMGGGEFDTGAGNTMTFDFGIGTNGAGFGGEMLAGEGMDTVSDGLRGNDPNQGLSAATILSLLEEGSFDYSSIFTDQAS